MKKFFFILSALMALVSIPSCQKMPDYGSPEGKYWYTTYFDLSCELIDLGATRPGFVYNHTGENARNACSGIIVTVGDNGDSYTIRKDRINQYTVQMNVPVTLVFQMLAEDVARVDFYDGSGNRFSQGIFTRTDASVEYQPSPL